MNNYNSNNVSNKLFKKKKKKHPELWKCTIYGKYTHTHQCVYIIYLDTGWTATDQII